MKTEHYTYIDGHSSRVKPTNPEYIPSTHVIRIRRTHRDFKHTILMTTTESWPYPFGLKTELSCGETNSPYIAYTWFGKLTDLYLYLHEFFPTPYDVDHSQE